MALMNSGSGGLWHARELFLAFEAQVQSQLKSINGYIFSYIITMHQLSEDLIIH